MRQFLFLLFLPFLSACLEPVASDFDQESAGLHEQEILWINRIQRTTDLYGVPNASELDQAAATQYGVPIFEQVLPKMLADMQAGNIQAYSPDIEGEPMSVSELSQRLTDFGSSWQDISSLLYVFHVRERGYSRKGGFDAIQEDIEVIWYDLEGRFPEKRLAVVKVADLPYQIETAGKTTRFQEYLRARQYYAFPIRIITRERSYGLRNMDEAYFLKEKVMSGNWDTVTFLDGYMNLSEKTPVTLEPDQLEAAAGLYTFEPTDFPEVEDGAADSIQLYFAVKQDRLEAEWSWKGGEKEELYAENAQSFFSLQGDSYAFVQEEEQWQVWVRKYGEKNSQPLKGKKQ
jgi:hypothetical protein